MPNAFVDTDVVIRMLTGDDLAKQAAGVALFEQVEAGTITLNAPATVVADAVFVLSSPRLYAVPRTDIQALLGRLLLIPQFEVESRDALLDALDLYAATNLDFGDAMIVASMGLAGSRELYSYDRDFDSLDSVNRKEP